MPAEETLAKNLLCEFLVTFSHCWLIDYWRCHTLRIAVVYGTQIHPWLQRCTHQDLVSTIQVPSTHSFNCMVGWVPLCTMASSYHRLPMSQIHLPTNTCHLGAQSLPSCSQPSVPAGGKRCWNSASWDRYSSPPSTFQGAWQGSRDSPSQDPVPPNDAGLQGLIRWRNWMITSSSIPSSLSVPLIVVYPSRCCLSPCSVCLVVSLSPSLSLSLLSGLCCCHHLLLLICSIGYVYVLCLMVLSFMLHKYIHLLYKCIGRSTCSSKLSCWLSFCASEWELSKSASWYFHSCHIGIYICCTGTGVLVVVHIQASIVGLSSFPASCTWVRTVKEYIHQPCMSSLTWSSFIGPVTNHFFTIWTLSLLINEIFLLSMGPL